MWFVYLLLSFVVMLVSSIVVSLLWDMYGPSYSEDDEYKEWDND